MLGHGAGGGVGAPDLQAAAGCARELGYGTVLVEQPYRVAGRRSPPRAPVLDAAWVAVLAALAGELSPPLIVGGRSSGARVACRTADALSAGAVLGLAFPLQPPRRRTSGTPPPSRLDELDAVRVPVLVVQGERDPFGVPPRGKRRSVVVLPGDHGLKSDLPGLRKAVTQWLSRR